MNIHTVTLCLVTMILEIHSNIISDESQIKLENIENHPSVEPSSSPSYPTTSNPTFTPSFSPTLQRPTIYFNVSYTISNVTSLNERKRRNLQKFELSSESVTAITETTSESINVRNELVEIFLIEETSFETTIKTTKLITLPLSDFPSYEDDQTDILYENTTSLLTSAFESGALTSLLRAKSLSYNAPQTVNSSIDSVSFGDFVVTSPTQNSGGSSVRLVFSLADRLDMSEEEFGGMIAGSVIGFILVLIAILLAIRCRKQALADNILFEPVNTSRKVAKREAKQGKKSIMKYTGKKECLCLDEAYSII